MPTDEEMRRAMEADVAKELEALQADPDQRKIDEALENELPSDASTDVVAEESDGAAEADKEVKPASPRVVAEKLKKLGFDIDDETTDEELVEALLVRQTKIEQAAKAAEQKALEAEKRVQELATKKPEPDAKIEKPAEPAPDVKPKRKAPPALVRPDEALQGLVEWDDETRMFVGRDRFGAAGIEAAKQFNDYRAARLKREQELIDDPESLISGLSEDLEERLKAQTEAMLEARLQAKLDEIRKQQEEALGKTSQQTAQQKEEAEFTTFMESVKDKLYRLTPDGTVRQTLDGEPAWTDAGKLFRDEFNELYNFAPHLPQSQIAKKAYERVAKIASLTPAKSPAETAAEKKRAFVTKGRKHESGVPSGGNSATVQDKFASGNNVRLFEALLEDPDNDDNADLANYRK